MATRSRDLVEVTAYYVVFLLVGAGVVATLEGSLVWRFFCADLAMTVCSYIVSVVKKNTSIYDAYWSVIPFGCAVGLMYFLPMSDWSWAHVLVGLAIGFWSWRLTLNWARGWTGWDHEDWRYVDYRKTMGARFELMNFFGLQLMPTLLVFAACLPMFAVYQHVGAPGVDVLIGVGLMVVGTLLELVADNQLYAFRNRPNPEPGELLDTGLWGWVRHPNYLGEITFWFGLAAAGLSMGSPWWHGLGAIGILVLVRFASIPLKETRMRARRPSFDDYCRRVPALLPGRFS